MKVDATIAVTGLGGLDNPEPGTAVIRAIRRAWSGRLNVLGLCYDPWTNGAWLPGVADELFRAAPVADGDAAVLDRILDIHGQRSIDALLPCLDLEIATFARLSKRLKRKGIGTLLPDPSSLAQAAKGALPYFCQDNDIAAPRTLHVLNPADAPFAAERMGYPLMVKGLVADAVRVENNEAAGREAAKLNARWGGGVILQEVVDGDEYVVAMLAGADGDRLGRLPVRKLGVNERGKGVVGVSVDDPDLIAESERILELLDWRGPLELEFIRRRETGKLALLEINCRFPSWIFLSAFAGDDLPALYLKEILEPGQKRTSGMAGAVYMRDAVDTTIQADAMEDLTLRVRAKRSDNPDPAPDPSGPVVGITGVSAFEIILPGLGVARSLRRAGAASKLAALVEGPMDTSAHRAELFDAAHLLPHDSTGDRLVGILETARKRMGLDVVIPCLDGDVARLADVADDLAAIGIRALVPSPDALKARGKERFPDLGDFDGFTIPQTRILGSEDDVRDAGRALGYPLAIKGAIAGSKLASDEAHALALFRAGRLKSNDVQLAQQYVSGAEFAVAMVCDPAHEIAAHMAIKKILRCERGNTWGAAVADPPGVMTGLSELAARIGWTGPMEAEFIRDPVRERFHLIDVNPRYPAWINFCARAGVNLPEAALAILDGRTPKKAAPDRSLLWFTGMEDIPVPHSQMARLMTKEWFDHAAR